MAYLISSPTLYTGSNIARLPTLQSHTARKNHRFLVRSSLSMESKSSEIAHDYSPFLRIYKDGHVERLKGIEVVPASLDSKTKVQSKDVVFSKESNLASRIYLPKITNPGQKLPLLVYYHGGGFCVETPFSPLYHNHINNLVAEANVVAVSVDYRRAPEHPLPIAYHDSWEALKWVASHVHGGGPEEWLNRHVDFSKVFLGGDSAGANIAHQLAIRFGEEKVDGINDIGIILVHPYFWGKEPIGNEEKDPEKRKLIDGVWYFACPTTSGNDDPWINPLVDPKLPSLGCSRALVIVAGSDALRERGWHYYQELKRCGWGGKVEFLEADAENHVFHLENSTCENAVALVNGISAFINEDHRA